MITHDKSYTTPAGQAGQNTDRHPDTPARSITDSQQTPELLNSDFVVEDIYTPKYTVMYTVAIYAIFHHMEDLQVHVALARNTYFDEV